MKQPWGATKRPQPHEKDRPHPPCDSPRVGRRSLGIWPADQSAQGWDDATRVQAVAAALSARPLIIWQTVSARLISPLESFGPHWGSPRDCMPDSLPDLRKCVGRNRVICYPMDEARCRWIYYLWSSKGEASHKSVSILLTNHLYWVRLATSLLRRSTVITLWFLSPASRRCDLFRSNPTQSCLG
jgi:hypothetical protein